ERGAGRVPEGAVPEKRCGWRKRRLRSCTFGVDRRHLMIAGDRREDEKAQRPPRTRLDWPRGRRLLRHRGKRGRDGAGPARGPLRRMAGACRAAVLLATGGPDRRDREPDRRATPVPENRRQPPPPPPRCAE